MFFRNYVLVDYALEKTKNTVSDFDQHAEEAGPGPIRATDSGRGNGGGMCAIHSCVFPLAAWVLVLVHVRGCHPRW